jgi:hypothetical protein
MTESALRRDTPASEETASSLETPARVVARIGVMQSASQRPSVTHAGTDALFATVSTAVDQLVQAMAALPGPGERAATTQDMAAEEAFRAIPQMATPWPLAKPDAIHSAHP